MDSCANPRNFKPHPCAGQYWALRNPLGLALVEGLDPATDDVKWVQTKVWNALESGVSVCYCGMPDAELLWFTYEMPKQRLTFREPHMSPDDLRFGDCLILISTTREYVVFVGPPGRENPDRVCLMSSTYIPLNDEVTIWLTLYQAVYRDPNLPQNVYERILRDSD